MVERQILKPEDLRRAGDIFKDVPTQPEPTEVKDEPVQSNRNSQHGDEQLD